MGADSTRELLPRLPRAAEEWFQPARLAQLVEEGECFAPWGGRPADDALAGCHRVPQPLYRCPRQNRMQVGAIGLQRAVAVPERRRAD
ncbi:MAG: hypothetical protein M3380_08525, partial [Chloroflexota bacterium]|nr:hypothetical protein [Chloroflexota bacterium]